MGNMFQSVISAVTDTALSLELPRSDREQYTEVAHDGRETYFEVSWQVKNSGRASWPAGLKL
jgi:hypothetical protein